MTLDSLRGDYAATLGGIPLTFDTMLGTIARIEETCGGRSIMEIVNGVVTGRRAADQMALLSAVLQTGGKPRAEAEQIAAKSTVPEAEAFILALMGALGFKLTSRAGEAQEHDPLDGSRDGAAGANSLSAA